MSLITQKSIAILSVAAIVSYIMEKLLEFFSTSKPSFYKKRDIVLRVGVERAGAFFLKRGYIKDASVSEDGQEFALFIFQPGDIFSYDWIFNKIPNEHSFVAISDCIVYEKSREGLLLFLEQNTDVQLMVTQNIVIRMRGLVKRIEGIVFGSAYQRVCSIFYILQERFGKSGNKGVTIPIHLTQQDIAQLIGLSRETTSIEINKLLDLKIILRISGYYIIMKQKSLRKLAGLY